MKYNNTYKWNQNEIDALVSFAYNIGSIKQLTNNGTRSKKEISTAMLKYNKAGGKVYRGLTRRRVAEQKLFLTPVKTTEKKVEKEVKKDYTKDRVAGVKYFSTLKNDDVKSITVLT